MNNKNTRKLKMRVIIISLGLLFITGCASTNSNSYQIDTTVDSHEVTNIDQMETETKNVGDNLDNYLKSCKAFHKLNKKKKFNEMKAAAKTEKDAYCFSLLDDVKSKLINITEYSKSKAFKKAVKQNLKKDVSVMTSFLQLTEKLNKIKRL